MLSIFLTGVRIKDFSEFGDAFRVLAGRAS